MKVSLVQNEKFQKIFAHHHFPPYFPATATARDICENDTLIFSQLKLIDMQIQGQDGPFQELVMCETVKSALDFMTSCGGTSLVTSWLKDLRDRLATAKMPAKLVEITEAGMAKDESKLKQLCPRLYPKV